MANNTPTGIEGEASHRNLHFFWLIDWSGSMHGTKIQKVNWAIREVLPEIRQIEDTERVKITMRAIRFGDKAEWHIGPNPVPVDQFQWKDMTADGGMTSTAQAVRLLTEALEVNSIGTRNVPPVCILLSDGHSSDSDGEYQQALDALNASPWGAKAVRISIGIGDKDSDYDKDELDAFISPYLRQESGLETLNADTPAKLVQYIRLVSVVASLSSSRSKESGSGGAVVSPVHIQKEALEPDAFSIGSKVDASEVF